MTNTDQSINLRPRNKVFTTVAVSVAGVIFAGLVLGWWAFGFFGSFRPALFHAFSNLATALTSFSLLLRPEDELIVVSSDQSVHAGDPFTLVLRRVSVDSSKGVHSISYPCTPGFKLEHVYNEKTKELACGEKTPLGNEELTNATLKATLTGIATLNVPLTVYFKGVNSDDDKPLYAQTLITIVKGDAAVTQNASTTSTVSGNGARSGSTIAKPTLVPKQPVGTKPVLVPVTGGNKVPATNTTGSTGQTNGTKTEKTFVYYSTDPASTTPAGSIDLEARILEVGFVDKVTNVFTASSSPSANLRIAVKFEVINKGTKGSGSWAFNAVLPTMPFHIYSGDSQQPLMPGDRIEFVIGFDSIDRKPDAEFIVNVDPTNSVMEQVKSNNIVKTIIHPVF